METTPLFNDAKSATTGLASMLWNEAMPGLAFDDPARAGLIDAPDWVPTGSHRRVLSSFDGETVIVFGEVGREDSL